MLKSLRIITVDGAGREVTTVHDRRVHLMRAGAREGGAAHIDMHGFHHAALGREIYSVLPNEPSSATGEVVWTHEMRRDGRSVKTITETRLAEDVENFRIEGRPRAWQGETLVRDMTWDRAIPRKMV